MHLRAGHGAGIGRAAVHARAAAVAAAAPPPPRLALVVAELVLLQPVLVAEPVVEPVLDVTSGGGIKPYAT